MKEAPSEKRGETAVFQLGVTDANAAVAIQRLPEQKPCPARSRMGRMNQVASIFSCIHALETSATSDVGCAHAARSSFTQIAPTDARGRI
jgi:hypothetical protein